MHIENEGNPTNWTLRFKHGRLTILLLTEDLTPLSTLKTELLDALRERYPAGIPKPASNGKKPVGVDEYITIPVDGKNVALAVLVDVHDMAKGWRQLGRVGKDALGLKETPRSMGIKDGAVLAFRFRGEDEVAEDDEDVDEEEAEEVAQKFLVEWPSYDETYGEAELGGEDVEMD